MFEIVVVLGPGRCGTSRARQSPASHAPFDDLSSYLRIELTGGAAVLKYDPNTAPEGFSTDLVAADLSAFTPNTTQCPAQAPPT